MQLLGGLGDVEALEQEISETGLCRGERVESPECFRPGAWGGGWIANEDKRALNLDALPAHLWKREDSDLKR
jgi:hypothetical protein